MWQRLSALRTDIIKYAPGTNRLSLSRARHAKGCARALTCTASSDSQGRTAARSFPLHSGLRVESGLTISPSQQRTIYALSTPHGKAGVAVIRVSGPGSREVWRRMIKRTSSTKTGQAEKHPAPARMYRCRIVDPMSDETLDDGLAVFFKGPRSFTTEDVLELHVHSGRAVIASVLASLSRVPLCRPAEPGEFTRRAFEGGRLDLTEVEGLKDLVDADTDAQRRIALRAVGGMSRARFEEMRSEIIRCLALVEALIDFGEGEDIEDGVYENARAKALALHATIEQYLAKSKHGEIVRSGLRLTIFGPPNSGKSSLLNFLAQREAAIVTPVPGTTRDIIELSLDIGGLPVIVTDTAGLRKTEDVVETIGLQRATTAVQAADVTICVLSLPEVLDTTPQGPVIRIPPSVNELVKPTTYFLFNKSDLVSMPTLASALRHVGTAWTVSLTKNTGTADFLAGLASALRERYDLSTDMDTADQVPIITHARQRVHLEHAKSFLEEFLDASESHELHAFPAGEFTDPGPNDVVLGAEALRYAARAVGEVTGAICAEDVLDSVFRDFCIGK